MQTAEFADIESTLAEYGTYASVTRGASMRPLFRTHRDMVILARPEGLLSKYDVALYKVGSMYVLHRVVGIDKTAGVYLVRGDNTYAKEYIPFDKILAVLVSFNRKGKRREVADLSYRIYSRLWNFIYPIRFLLRKTRAFLGKIKRKIFN